MDSPRNPNQSTIVSVAACASYDPDRIAVALADALVPLGGMRAFVPPDARVLIKPNLLKRAAPDAAVTTHPELVRTVIRQVRAAGAGEVLVGDSPGGPASERGFRALTEAAGLAQVCAEENALLVQFAEPVRAEVPAAGRGHARFAHFELGREAVEADVLVNLPKLKTHGFMMMTGAVKNLFGLIPGLAKAGYHVKVPDRDAFAEMLVDLALARPPQLTVMDAVVAMEGQGPGGGTPRRIGALLASADPFGMDVIAAAICGFSPDEVYTNVAARRRGLAPALPEDVPTSGVPWRSLVGAGFVKPPRDMATLMPKWASGMLRGALLPRPRLATPAACTACGICARSCPVDAIRIESGGGRGDEPGPVFDYDRCIRCYCCHEMCPPQAIKLRSPWLLRAVTKGERGE